MTMRTPKTTLPLSIGLLLTASSALGQQAPAAPSGGDQSDTGNQSGGPQVTVVQVPSTPAPAMTPYGPLPTPGWNPDAHLPSSSHAVTDINGDNDHFDIGQKPNPEPSVRGDKNGSYVVEGQFVPEAHSVRRGDTLWEISSRYYQNPYRWPQIWAFNPQIQNPHWIYPGDRIRLREPGEVPKGLGFTRHRAVPLQTVFLRDVGWIDSKDDDDWGELIGSEQDRMLLSDGFDCYIQLKDNHDVSIGQELTIWLPIRTIDSHDAKGELVGIRGTARVDRYNPKTHTVKAHITESLDVIERGARVGPVGRRFDVVPPVTAESDIEANIVATIYADQVIGQNQVVFLDKGELDGVKVGYRFFAVYRGDRWVRDINNAGQTAKLRPLVHEEKPAHVEKMKTTVDTDILPDETYAELRVLRVRDHSATALIVASQHEVDKNARVFAKKGY